VTVPPDTPSARPSDAHTAPSIVLERWNGPWADDDPDANFKAEVARYRLVDPLHTLRGLSAHTGIPLGALARYVLARYATTGSEGLLQLGGATVRQMADRCAAAEAEATDEARLDAYRALADIVSWLAVPAEDPTVYEGHDR